MERKITITYRWWRDSKEPIKDAHIVALEESAMDRIKEMMNAGYTSGELSDNVFMNDDDIEDGNEGIEYSGWWSVEVVE